MISLLLCDQHDVIEAKNCIERIIAATDNMNSIEFIITTDHQDKVSSFKKALLHQYAVRITIKSHGSYSLKNSQREIFNFAWLQLHRSSTMVIPIFSHQIKMTTGWDTQMRNIYHQATQQFGHDLFVIQAEENYFYTTNWLDISGGFGLINDINAWTVALLNQIENKLSRSLAFLISSKLISENSPAYSLQGLPAECQDMLDQLVSSCADSVVTYIANLQYKKEVANQLDKMDLIETCNYIAEHYSSIYTYSMLLQRYFAEASGDIIRQNTFPLLNVFLTAILNKRQLLDRQKMPEELLAYLDNWQMKEMPEIRVESFT